MMTQVPRIRISPPNPNPGHQWVNEDLKGCQARRFIVAAKNQIEVFHQGRSDIDLGGRLVLFFIEAFLRMHGIDLLPVNQNVYGGNLGGNMRIFPFRDPRVEESIAAHLKRLLRAHGNFVFQS